MSREASVQRTVRRVRAVKARLSVSGGTHGRNIGSTLSGRRLHWMLGALLPLSLSFGQAAHALPPLVKAADLAQADLQGFWRNGEFMVGVPHLPARPALLPLQNNRPSNLPPDLSGWTVIGQSCDESPRHQDRLGGVTIEAAVGGDAMHPTVELRLGGRLVAEALLGRPAKVCEVHITDADAIVGPEILVAWRLGSAEDIRGFTVYRVPESLDPTPVSPPD